MNDACPPVPVCPRSGVTIYPRTQIVVRALSGRHPTESHWVRAGPNIPSACFRFRPIRLTAPYGAVGHTIFIFICYLVTSLRRFSGEINNTDILMAFFTLPVFMAVCLNSVRETNKVKTAVHANYHKQPAAVGAFDFFLSLWLLRLFCPVSAISHGRPKFGRKAMHLDNIKDFLVFYSLHKSSLFFICLMFR